jgi:hypothetical protein
MQSGPLIQNRPCCQARARTFRAALRCEGADSRRCSARRQRRCPARHASRPSARPKRASALRTPGAPRRPRSPNGSAAARPGIPALPGVRHRRRRADREQPGRAPRLPPLDVHPREVRADRDSRDLFQLPCLRISWLRVFAGVRGSGGPGVRGSSLGPAEYPERKVASPDAGPLLGLGDQMAGFELGQGRGLERDGDRGLRADTPRPAKQRAEVALHHLLGVVQFVQHAGMR